MEPLAKVLVKGSNSPHGDRLTKSWMHTLFEFLARRRLFLPRNMSAIMGARTHGLQMIVAAPSMTVELGDSDYLSRVSCAEVSVQSK